MPSYPIGFPNFPPGTFNYASGDPRIGGTPTPSGSVGHNYSLPNPQGTIFEEYSDSPEIESGEQSTIVHRYNCDPATAQYLLLTYPRGTVLTDTQGFTSRILSVKIQPLAKSGRVISIVTITSEAMSFGIPPDEFNITVESINPALEKHPRYYLLSYQDRYNVRQANQNASWDVTQTYQLALNSIPNKTPNGAATQSLELINKNFKGEDTFYLNGYKVTWSTYYWFPVIVNPGGYIEDPVYGGGLPPQYWSTDGTVTGTNIFAETTNYNPNLYPQTGSNNVPPFGLSWLHQTDTLDLNRTWFKLTRSWIGGTIGTWDAQLYSSTPAPYDIYLSSGNIIGA